MECNSSNCTLILDRSKLLPGILYTLITIAGFFIHSLTVFILVFSRNLNTKFFQLWKIFSLNILLNNIFTLSIILTSIFLNLKFYFLNETTYVDNFLFSVYISYIYMFFWVLTYTFEGLLDIVMVYERILLLNLDIQFLRKTSILLTSFCIFIFSIVVNIPINVSRVVIKKNILTNTGESMELYSIGQYEYGYSRLLILSIYFTSFIRDVLAAVSEIIINIFLVYNLSNYFKRRYNLTSINVNGDRNRFIYLSKSEQKNTIINCLLCCLSTINHILTFLVFFLLENGMISLYRYIRPINGLVHGTKNYICLFIFVTLNKQFRKNFLALLPKNLIKRKKKKVTVIRHVECINLENFVTHL